MDFNKLTVKSGEAVGAAQELARRLGNPELVPDHLTIALLDQELPRTLVERAGADSRRASRRGGGAPAIAAFRQRRQRAASGRLGPARVLSTRSKKQRRLVTTTSPSSTSSSASSSFRAMLCSRRSSRYVAGSA